MLKKLSKVLFSRLVIVCMLILIQVVWIVLLAYRISATFTYASAIIRALAIIVSLRIANKRSNPTMKLAWTFIILAVPVLGLTLYWIFGRSDLNKKMRIRFERTNREFEEYLKGDENLRKQLKELDPNISNQSEYINKWAGFPLCQNTSTDYFASGEEMFEQMKKDLENATHYIFLEYFIIEPGHMWNSIQEILERKIKEGVEVRLIYDDVGCISTLPHHYYKLLQSKEIKCAAFNPFRPMLSIIMNNRDHRKILVIDGFIAYTGGINLADEYINKIERFGYWKDTGIRLEGEAVWNFTAMFLEMWNSITHTDMPQDYLKYKPYVYHEEEFGSDGFVQPYCDSPLDGETVGENVYLNMISKAKKYVYIFTPYLVTDNELVTTLCIAAKSGVDVRIVIPGIPDKKIVYWVGESYFPRFIEAGIKIYRFKPGFIHAKCFVCDDEVATVGTFNMDYRSLYLHFECGVWMYKSKAVKQMKEDMLQTFEQSELITSEDCKNRFWLVKSIQELFILFAPLL